MSSTSRAKSVAQQLIEELKASEGVKIKCPCCDEKRAATKYVMFATGDMPGEVKALLKAQEDAIKTQSARHVLREQRLENAALNSQRISFGRFAENLIPATPAFPGNPADFRHLGSPIDYIGFHGLTSTGLIESIEFVDAKAGPAPTKSNQKLIANAVAQGRVSVRVINDSKAKPKQRKKAVR